MSKQIVKVAELSIWAIWFGGLWMMALLVAPALFKWLPRPEAGLVAGRLFFLLSCLSVVVTPTLLLLAKLSGFSIQRIHVLGLLTIVAVALLGLLVVQPHMNQIRTLMLAASGDELVALKKTFGRLHGLSSVMFSVQMLLGLWWGCTRFLSSESAA
jgi:hypothetical protein